MNKWNNIYYQIFIMLLLGQFNTVNAQDELNVKSGNLFELQILPEFGYTDNFLYSNENKQDTQFTQLNSKALIQTQLDNQLFKLNLNFEHVSYSEFSDDDHSNFSIKPQYQYKFSSNKAFYISGDYRSFYERRGTGLSLGDGESLKKGDEKETLSYKSGYLYGTKDSVAKFNIGLGGNTQEYQTRREVTQEYDYATQYINSTFDYLLSGQAYISLEVGVLQTEYDEREIFDKDVYFALTGIKWRISEITQVEALVGYQDIRFKEPTFTDDDAFKWRFDMNWKPTEFTQITFTSGRDFEEANRLDDSYRTVDNFSIAFHSKVTDLITLSALLSQRYETVTYTERIEDEDYLYFDSRLTYKRSDLLSFFLRYTYDDLSSSENWIEYSQTGISLGFHVSI